MATGHQPWSDLGRLDGVHGAVVRITELQPGWPSGPRVELLYYRAPSTGRQAPYDTARNDLAHAHLVLHVNDLERQVCSFRDNHVRFVPPGIVTLGNGIDAVIVCDPEGHVLLLEGSANGQ